MHLSAGAIPKLNSGIARRPGSSLCPTISRTLDSYLQRLLVDVPLPLRRVSDVVSRPLAADYFRLT